MNMGCYNGGYHEFNLDWFLEKFEELITNNQKLLDTVREIMEAWEEDGTISNMVNVDQYNKLQSVVTKLQGNFNDLEKNVLTSDSTDYVGMAQLTQDVKKALTGGSTAVVGKNAVSNDNIVDGTIMGAKLNPSAKIAFLNPLNNYAKLDTAAKTLTIKLSGLINGVSFSTTEQTLAVPEGNNYIYVDPDNVISIDSVSGGRKTPVGIVNPTNLSMFYGCKTYVDGRDVNGYDFYLPAGINGAKQVLIFDFPNNKIIMPDLFYVFLNGRSISISNQEDLDMASYSGLFYNESTNKLYCASNSADIRIAYFVQSSNLVQCNYPHKILSNDTKAAAMSFDIPMFGDSIVAGAGKGTCFIQLINMRTPIRLLNYGIGSSGYLTNATGLHLTGNGDEMKGTNQDLTGDNTIYANISKHIGEINSRYVAIFAGTNDYDKEVDSVTTEMIRCASLIFNNNKIPIIFSPIPRQNVNLKPLIDDMEAKCISANIPFVNMWAIGFHPSNGYNLQEFYSDGLHPSKSGHELLACVISDALKKYIATDFTSTVK